MIEPNVCFFYQTGFCHNFHGLFLAKISVYGSFWNNKRFTVFCFCFAEIWCSDWVRLLQHQYQNNIPAFFWRRSAGITAFLWKIVAVNLNSQQKFYDNSASAVLWRLAAVSAAILEKKQRVSKNFDPGSEFYFDIDTDQPSTDCLNFSCFSLKWHYNLSKNFLYPYFSKG